LRTPSKRPPTAQVAAAKGAAAIKATNAGRTKAAALASMPDLAVTDEQDSATMPAHREHDRHRAQAPRAPPPGQGIRLLDKAEVLAITSVSFPTVWAWMRSGTFPRSRVAGGKSMWLSTEIDAWLAALPIRRLKGDPQQVELAHEPEISDAQARVVAVRVQKFGSESAPPWTPENFELLLAARSKVHGQDT
jgi:predicted DNA-binding transcriptional regulator AlpA